MKCDSLILGKIVTLDTDKCYVEAIACKDKRVVYAGSREIAETLCGENTRVYDYGENVVYPGFWDSHTHGEMAGQRLGFQCDLSKITTMEGYVKAMKEYAEARPDQAFYLGAGWDLYSEPNAGMLDAICPDKPMVLRSLCGHMAWVNTAAMKELHCDAEKARKVGYSMIHVDDHGEPTGWVTELAAQEFVDYFKPTKEEMKQGLLLWQDFAFKNGMTAVIEAYADMYDTGLEAYRELEEEGKWKLRTYAFPTNAKLLKDGAAAIADAVEQQVKDYNGEYFKVVGEKLFFDGVVDAYTADLIEDYADRPDSKGFSPMKGKEQIIRDIIRLVNAKGLPVHIHSIGDGATKKAMDVIEESEQECCNFDLRNMICHLELVRPEDIRRMSDYNVVAVTAPLWVHKDPAAFKREVQKLGEDRAYAEFPIKSFEEAGTTVTFHTDYPITPVVDIPKEIYQAVKRGAPGEGPKSVRNADEGITPLQTLLALTVNAAYAVRKEQDLGVLTIGKIANMVVYDRDFLTADVNDIASAKLIATIIDGDPVYGNAD